MAGNQGIFVAGNQMTYSLLRAMVASVHMTLLAQLLHLVDSCNSQAVASGTVSSGGDIQMFIGVSLAVDMGD